MQYIHKPRGGARQEHRARAFRVCSCFGIGSGWGTRSPRKISSCSCIVHDRHKSLSYAHHLGLWIYCTQRVLGSTFSPTEQRFRLASVPCAAENQPPPSFSQQIFVHGDNQPSAVHKQAHTPPGVGNDHTRTISRVYVLVGEHDDVRVPEKIYK